MAPDDLHRLPPDVDGHIGRMAAELDAEVRAEQEQYEVMALQTRWRARSVADVVRDWMVHGDAIEVEAGSLRLTGLIAHAGEDYFVVATHTRGAVDVALSPGPTLRMVQAGAGPGVPPVRGSRRLVARLTEYETAGVDLTVVLDDGAAHDGRVLAAATDHVLLDTRHGHRVLPYKRIVLVWTEPAP